MGVGPGLGLDRDGSPLFLAPSHLHHHVHYSFNIVTVTALRWQQNRLTFTQMSPTVDHSNNGRRWTCSTAQQRLDDVQSTSSE
jgi:hypothetical protein